MNQSNQSKQVLLSVIGVAILVVAVVGVSFAFFNYTRTGSANTVKTGHIEFNSSNTLMNLQNAFPIAKTAVSTDTTNTATATVTITGQTNYVNGIDYVVTAEEVSSNIGTTTGKLPISVVVTTSGLPGTPTVTSYEDGSVITSGSPLVRGNIPGNNTAVNGTITVKAYIDSAGVAITDTLEGGNIAVDGYTNGTTQSGTGNWVNGRTVMTTAQWNALATTPATFKIKVVANEGAGS